MKRRHSPTPKQVGAATLIDPSNQPDWPVPDRRLAPSMNGDIGENLTNRAMPV